MAYFIHVHNCVPHPPSPLAPRTLSGFPGPHLCAQPRGPAKPSFLVTLFLFLTHSFSSSPPLLDKLKELLNTDPRVISFKKFFKWLKGCSGRGTGRGCGCTGHLVRLRVRVGVGVRARARARARARVRARARARVKGHLRTS